MRKIEKSGDWRIEIETGMDIASAPEGASVACSGCCLTIIEKGKGWFAAEASKETLSKTTLGRWEEGTKINIELSMKLGDELGGHFVFGHVDGVAVIEDIQPDGESHIIKIGQRDIFRPYVVAKGSVTLDGVSLTVNEVSDEFFSVNLIPHSWAKTTFQFKKPGDVVNFEIDMLARYVAGMLKRDAA